MVPTAILIAGLKSTSCTSTTPTEAPTEAPTKAATEAEFSFTFESHAEGWTSGFADLPADFEPSIYELDSGHRSLPHGLEGNGLYIQGHNRSADLFMFFKRQVEGLKAGATYAASASIDLATNVPSGSIGIGGSPGESVSVKAGAATVEPVAEGEDLRMNIDKGNQANGGEAMVVLGNVAHPDVIGEEYRIKSLENSGSPVDVTADGEGRLWLIVGTDSGFEGLSTLYYARIAFRLRMVEPANSGISLLGSN